MPPRTRNRTKTKRGKLKNSFPRIWKQAFGKQTPNTNSRRLAIVTGASAGIGYHLAALCAKNGFDLVVAADEPAIAQAARAFETHGVTAEAVEADLATIEGVDQLLAKVAGRPVAALLANAGHGLGKAFLDQDFDAARHVIETNRRANHQFYEVDQLKSWAQSVRASSEPKVTRPSILTRQNARESLATSHPNICPT